MSQSRLATALASGELTLPPGIVEVHRPPADYDLPLGPHAARIVHGFRPDADAWERAGYAVSATPGGAAAALVVVPRSKALARDMIARAAAGAPLVIVDGQRTDGVDSLWKAVRARIGDVPNVVRAHGRLFWFEPGEAFADWRAPGPAPTAEGFHTVAGVFSEGEVDRGSRLLAEALPARLPARVADLGAGWGYLAAAILRREGVETLDLVEAERASLDCARLNVTDPRAAFHWADATAWRPETPLGAAVMNPPFHTGRAPDPALGRTFIAAAAAMLSRDGALWMVANRHLPYETELRDRFAKVEEIGGDGAFKLVHASRPKRRNGLA